MPNEVVSAVSGFKAGLPPIKPLYCEAVFDRMCRYAVEVTPVRAQCGLGVAGGRTRAAGPCCRPEPPIGARTTRSRSGARTARWKLPRKRTSEIGAQSTPNL